MKRNLTILIGGLIVVAGVIFILFSGAPNSTATELNLKDLVGNRDKYAGRFVSTEGYVEIDSINWNADKVELNFTVNDHNGNQMDITYNGTKPDNFTTDDVIAMVQGKLEKGEDGRFVAEKLQTKCPSKYEGQDPANDPNLSERELEDYSDKN